MKKTRQTNNAILRWYGNLCAYLGNFFYKQSERYCDLYILDDDFLKLIKDDSTGVWDPDATE